MGPYASSGWSDLPIDLLIRIVHLLELPEALAFRAVCPSWCSASAAAGAAPPRRTPWLMSLADDPLSVSFPRGQAVACCGASHGWLIMANELSDLVLYNPFTAALIPLPPITGFSSCIEGVYGDEGKIVGYRYGCYMTEHVHGVQSPGRCFYDKVVLSGPPSTCRAVTLVIHLDGKRLSFARIGDSHWQQVSVIQRSGDSIYHRGRFYAVTMEGILKSWDFGGLDKPRKKTVIAGDERHVRRPCYH
ncbi:unnamed protein product [Triticum turgidum subsp. durum]|uniref:F-box domain-containing protein n=1 Tax=Triticum turgidum subsp. durum TaxID=4567 RepID=A0A9R1AYE9_TRITD|nr:unnamed protein product [Triticum turgidum subsp. durum]